MRRVSSRTIQAGSWGEKMGGGGTVSGGSGGWGEAVGREDRGSSTSTGSSGGVGAFVGDGDRYISVLASSSSSSSSPRRHRHPQPSVPASPSSYHQEHRDSSSSGGTGLGINTGSIATTTTSLGDNSDSDNIISSSSSISTNNSDFRPSNSGVSSISSSSIDSSSSRIKNSIVHPASTATSGVTQPVDHLVTPHHLSSSVGVGASSGSSGISGGTVGGEIRYNNYNSYSYNSQGSVYDHHHQRHHHQSAIRDHNSNKNNPIPGSGDYSSDSNSSPSGSNISHSIPISSNKNNGVSSGSSTNRTLTGLLSLFENGGAASSVYSKGGGGDGDGHSRSSSISRSSSGSNRILGNTNNPQPVSGDIISSSSITSIVGEQLGVERLVHTNYDDSGGGGGVFDALPDDYNYNYNGVLLDNNNNEGGLLSQYAGGNVSLSLSDIDSFSEQLFNQIEFKMGDDLMRYVCPVIIVLGNLTNLMAFLVLCRNKFKTSSVAFYMRAYALANLCFLNLMMGVAWLCFILDAQYVAHRTDWSCRLWMFISNVITYSGIWFVVVMSIDRIVYSNLPSKASGYCSVFTAKGVTIFVVICLIVVSIHAMWTFELQPHGCWVSHHQDDLHKLTWPWWSAALYSYIPLLLLLVQIILQSVYYCVRVFMKRSHSPPTSARRQPPPDHDTLVVPVFVITVAFFVFTIPSTAINLLDIHLPSNLLRVDVIAKIELTKKITELLSGFNYSLMGLVLPALSPSFQTELVAVFRTLFCATTSRTFKVFELRNVSHSGSGGGSGGGGGGGGGNNNNGSSSPQTQADYELCNNHEDNLATDV